MIADISTNSSRKSREEEQEIIDIPPCALLVTHEHGRFRTVVGSGISVCLYDRHNRISGINHFLLPRITDPEKATGRYGNTALIGLLRLLRENCPCAEPVAYIAGGAYCDEFEIDSALDNIRIAWQFLFLKQIPIISQYLGGSSFREVLFDTSTGVFTARACKI